MLIPFATLAILASSTPPLATQRPTATSAPVEAGLRGHTPDTTVAWFESTALEPLLREGFAHPLIAGLLAQPLIAQDLEAKGIDPVEGAEAVETLLGQSPFELVHALGSGGIGVGFLDMTPGKEAPFLMLRGLDLDVMEEALDELEVVLSGLGAIESMETSLLGRTVERAWRSAQLPLVAAWTADGTLVVAKDAKDVRTCCSASGGSASIAAAFRGMRTSSKGTLGWLDLDALEEQVGLKDLRAMASDPGVHFVLGPAITYLGRASSLAMELVVSNRALQLRLHGMGVDAGQGAGSFPERSRRPAESRDRAEIIAHGFLHRDLDFLLKHRVDLFPPRAQPGIAEGLANFALLVGGPDALDELTASLHPTLQLEASQIQFAEDALPDVALPSMSIHVGLEHPEINGARLISAFQSAVSLTNVQRAMNGEEGLALGLDSVDGITLTKATWRTPPAGASVDVSHNLEPACALVADRFLIGTHRGPVTALVRRFAAQEALKETLKETQEGAWPGGARPPSGPWIPIDHLLVEARPLSDLLEEQRDLIVMNAVLEAGKTQERAEAEADTLLKLTRRVTRIDYRSDWTPESETARAIRAVLVLQLQPE